MQRSMENNTCHGQCYLMQKLKKQQENEQQNFKVNFHESYVANPEVFSFDIAHLSTSLVEEFNVYSSNLFPRDFVYSLDRPPLLG